MRTVNSESKSFALTLAMIVVLMFASLTNHAVETGSFTRSIKYCAKLNTDSGAERIDQGFMLVLYPNPFVTELNIVFTKAQSEAIQIDVVDTKGQVIRELFKGTAAAHQQYTLKFDGKELSDGIYFVRLITSTGVYNNRVILHKENQR